MAKLYPDAMQSMALHTIEENSPIHTPPAQDFDTPAMDGSIQQFLADNLGEFVVVEFLVGTQSLVQKSGILYAVGSSVLTLYEEMSQTFITCDIFSVKFVTFYLPGHRPWQVTNPAYPQSVMEGAGSYPGTTTPCGNFHATL
jgi:hypothetical protein